MAKKNANTDVKEISPRDSWLLSMLARKAAAPVANAQQTAEQSLSEEVRWLLGQLTVGSYAKEIAQALLGLCRASAPDVAQAVEALQRWVLALRENGDGPRHRRRSRVDSSRGKSLVEHQ